MDSKLYLFIFQILLFLVATFFLVRLIKKQLKEIKEDKEKEKLNKPKE